MKSNPPTKKRIQLLRNLDDLIEYSSRTEKLLLNTLTAFYVVREGIEFETTKMSSIRAKTDINFPIDMSVNIKSLFKF
ncbi:hypothetical protein PG913_05190 [Tenacibaculum pacificus]|uniref:hypothetical protein n=1 Tax=Tenacibaculum pacificus TaxID=3018314 RepID=UPI0022F3F0CA|nr:hypothetical protein [Tenacibaculum pacificus]WBX74584.1 hypothetical protein PG913_05190 [Tenacibaculum pacificus]